LAVFLFIPLIALLGIFIPFLFPFIILYLICALFFGLFRKRSPSESRT
jgi:predicted membrane channel-forming protein YqfA (hemolysin III family)